MPRILIVEDDRNTRLLVVQLLSRTGYDVAEADNGLNALKLLDNDSDFDLILSDVRMAGMDGLELLASVKQYYSSIPVLMLSVHTRSDWVEQALETGAAGYLRKPFTGDELLNAVQSIVPI